MAVWATGPPQIEKTISNVIKVDFASKIYGRDYINIGYKAGNQGLINAILRDLKAIYITDVQGTDINQFEIMKPIKNLKDFSLIIGIGSGSPGLKEWIQFGGDPSQVPVAGGMTAVEAPLLYPYYPKQLLDYWVVCREQPNSKPHWLKNIRNSSLPKKIRKIPSRQSNQ